MEKTLWNSRKSPWEGILASFFRLSNVFQALYILKGREKHTTVMLFPFSCLVPHPIVHTYPISSKHHIKFRLCSHTCWRNIYLHLKGSLGKPPKQIFGKSWDFGPTGLTPPPSPNVGIPKKEKKSNVYFAF